MPTDAKNTPDPEDVRYQDFVRLFAHHEPDLRRFIRSLLPTAVDADEVLQQTAIVIWRKFDQFDPQTNFMKWACVISRFEALAYRRKMARDRLVFREDVMSLMADEGEQEVDLAHPRTGAKVSAIWLPVHHGQASPGRLAGELQTYL